MQTPEQEGDEQMLVPAEQSSAAGGASGGPKTGEGKEAMRWNVTRHGISSPAPAVPNLEKREDWEEHRSGILHNLSPVGRLEVNSRSVWLCSPGGCTASLATRRKP
jgi:hypothetical protein